MARFSLASRRKAAVGILVAVALAGVAAQRVTRSSASSVLVILVASPTDAGADTRERRARIASQLAEAVSALPQVRIDQVDQQGAAPDGAGTARELGRRYHAAIVVWDAATPGTPAPSVVVEALSPQGAVPFLSVHDYMTEAVLVEPDSVAFAAAQGQGVVEFVSGMVQSRRAEYAHAVEHLTRALDATASSDVQSKVLLSRGNALLALGRADAAIADYSRAIELNPRLLGASANRATALLKLAAPARAADGFARAPELGPQIQGNQAAADAAQGRHQAAIDVYDRIIQANREDGVAYLNRGVSRAVLGDHRHALEDFTRALQLNPMDATAYYDRGLDYAAQGALPRAIEDYSAALHLNPQDAAAYYARGVAQASLGKYGPAVEDLTHAVQLNPRFEAAYRDRGASHLLLGRLDQAIADATDALRLDPNDANAYFNRGLSHMLRGDPQKAIADMEQVLQTSKDPALRKNAEEQLTHLRNEQ